MKIADTEVAQISTRQGVDSSGTQHVIVNYANDFAVAGTTTAELPTRKIKSYLSSRGTRAQKYQHKVIIRLKVDSE